MKDLAGNDHKRSARGRQEGDGKANSSRKPAYNRIKAVLAEENMSNKELAAKLGKTPSAVSNWCRNDKQPDLPTLFEIAVALGVEPASLINSIQKAGLGQVRK
jgi:transcriptional regulator with XRE-family HTH domain